MFEILDLNHELWVNMVGAYGMVWDGINEYLTSDSDTKEEALENLCESISHQMTFYSATYIVLPYLIKELIQSDDKQWQITLLTQIGIVVSTYNDTNKCEVEADSEIINNLKNALVDLAIFTKKFIVKNIKEVKKLEYNDKKFFALSILAIIGDKTLAYSFINCSFEYFYYYCADCDTYNEDMEEIEEENVYLKPAESVIGLWNQNDFEDEYIWYTNYLDLIGLEEKTKLMPYVYGNYICPNCGKEHFMKEAYKSYFIGE